MGKLYHFIAIIVGLFLFHSTAFGDLQKGSSSMTPNNQDSIPQLNIYPNPVTQGKLYISSKLNGTKTIEIYDVLGKKILEASLLGNSLDISELTQGVYILKVKEAAKTSTRKLVVR
ncbi:MAG: T9SS type A sorting domain-containing protein [Flavobacteriaceae bacterium]|nr:T9SS type A sorting domain-containing protein [Flavobacteriaceae bacterium]